MITTTEIEKLATLARIKLDDAEKQGLTKEIDSILTYIDQIKKATVAMDYTPAPGDVHNVFREDIVESTSPEGLKRIINEAPDHEQVGQDTFVAVKKIL